MAITKLTSLSFTDDSVVAAAIADNAVVTAAINADAVTAAKIADDAVVAAAIADNAVVTAAINANAVTAAKVTWPSDKIKWVKSMVLAGSGATSTATTMTDTGAEITIAAADIVGINEIIIIGYGSIRANVASVGGVNLTGWRVQRTAPSAATISGGDPELSNGDAGSGVGSEIQSMIALSGVDTSLSSADHTYKIQFRKFSGNANYTSNIYYKYKGWTLLAYGIYS